jgi:VanZ family protein
MWGPAAVWAAVLFLLSAWPDPVGPDWLSLSDKAVHLILYTVLGAALAWGRMRSGAALPHALPLLVGALYGATDELHQRFVRGRTPSFADWCVDLLGVFLGYLLVMAVARLVGGRDDMETNQRTM